MSKRRKYRYQAVLLITCAKLPGKEWRVRGTWKKHQREYLKSPPEAYDGLHYQMRRIGIDWFTAKTVKAPLSEERKTAISEGMRRSRVWNRGLKTGKRANFKPPNVKEWMIVTDAGTLTVRNLTEWIRKNGLNYGLLKMRIRRGNWPYKPPGASINILRISKWS